MVIFLVTHGDAFSLEFFQPLAVDLNTAGSGLRKGVILKDTSNMMEQSGDAQEYVRR